MLLPDSLMHICVSFAGGRLRNKNFIASNCLTITVNCEYDHMNLIWLGVDVFSGYFVCSVQSGHFLFLKPVTTSSAQVLLSVYPHAKWPILVNSLLQYLYFLPMIRSHYRGLWGNNLQPPQPVYGHFRLRYELLSEGDILFLMTQC